MSSGSIKESMIMDYAKPIPKISVDYDVLNDEDKGSTLELRKEHYSKLSLSYYFMVGGYYLKFWGMSWHFAIRHQWETFEAAIARHEMWLAYKLGIESRMNVLDAGCGIGGPLRTIARFTRAKITGINNDPYQIAKGKEFSKGLSFMNRCQLIEADFMKIPFPNSTFDVAYQLEASVHAPDKQAFYEEIFRVLKPGGVYGGYEWVMTDDYDENNAEHVEVKRGVEKSNGVPNIEKISVIVQSLQNAGFEIIEHFDVADTKEESDYPWYDRLKLPYYPIRRYLLDKYYRFKEFFGMTPKGTVSAWNLMQLTISSMRKSGELHIFSPMYYVKVRKPMNY